MIRDILSNGWTLPVKLNIYGNIAAASYEKSSEDSIRIIFGAFSKERVLNPYFNCINNLFVKAKKMLI